MTSPETPSPAPQRSALPGDGSWKAVVPTIAVQGIFLGIFLATQVALFAWFDDRFANGIDGVERRLTAQIVEVKTDLGARIDEVKTDLTHRIDGVEKRLTDRIDQVETGLNARIDRVEQRLTDRIDRVETELGTRIDEVKADLEASETRQSAVTKRLTAGIAGNRANHRELVGFVRAHYPGAPQPATEQPEPPPAQ